MSDFFADLERELRMAQRNERRPRAATIRRAVALAAAAAALIGVAATVLRGGDPERSVPAGDERGVTERYVVTNCVPADENGLPHDLREHFAVLTRPGEEPLPPEITIAEATGVKRFFSQHARVVERGRLRVAVHPVVSGVACGGASHEAGVCVGIYDKEERSPLTCRPVSRILARGLSVRAGGDLVVLVPDEVTEVSTEDAAADAVDNIAVLANAKSDDVRLGVGDGGWTAYAPAGARPEATPEGACTPDGRVLTEHSPPAEITRHFALLRAPDRVLEADNDGAVAAGAIQRVYLGARRTIVREAAPDVHLEPVLLTAHDCDSPEPAVCVSDDAVSTCATMEVILERGVQLVRGRRATIVVPDGVSQVVTNDGAELPVAGNLATAMLREGAEGVRVAALERR